MASAAATSPSSNARPRSAWDVVSDALGNAVARFDGLTGAGIGAHGVDAMVMPAVRAATHLASGATQAAHTVMRIGANAFDAAKKAAHVVTHPAPAIRGVQSAAEAALRRRGYGIALDVARAVVPGLPGAARDLYKSFSDWPHPWPARQRRGHHGQMVQASAHGSHDPGSPELGGPWKPVQVGD
jgi:hypothetical protein